MDTVRAWQILRGQTELPPTPLAGKWTLYVDEATGLLMIEADDGSTAPVGVGGGGGGAPSGPAGGDLAGSYPSPQIAAGVIVDADVAPANKDGAAATPSLRTLGTGATSAAAGNHAHAPAAPAAHATTHQPGGSDALAVDAAAGVGSLRTIGAGAVQAAAGSHAHAGMITNPMTTLGDLIAGGASGAPGRLGVGAADQVLSVVAGAPAWAAPAAAANLLANGGFEIWQRGAGPFTANTGYGPDRWRHNLGAGDALSVARDGTNQAVGSRYCAACAFTRSTGDSWLEQKIEDYAAAAGRTVTFAVDVRTATANAVRLTLYDGTATVRSAYHSGSGAYERLSLTRAVPAGSTALVVAVSFDATTTAYLDNATLCVGAAALPYAAPHPADDLARCLRYYQVWGGTAVTEFVAPGQCYATTRAQLCLVLQAPMGAPPTVTVSAPGDFLVWSATAVAIGVTAMASGLVTPRTVYLDATVAAGLVAGNATILSCNSSAARLSLAWNP